jgi:hypothetical protein
MRGRSCFFLGGAMMDTIFIHFLFFFGFSGGGFWSKSLIHDNMKVRKASLGPLLPGGIMQRPLILLESISCWLRRMVQDQSRSKTKQS